MQFSNTWAAVVLLAAVALTGLMGCGLDRGYAPDANTAPDIPATVEAQVQYALATATREAATSTVEAQYVLATATVEAAAATVEVQVQSTLTAVKRQDGIDRDRDALVALYNSAGGPRWKGNRNWLSSQPLEDWYGIATDEEGRVTEVKLILNGMEGTIPPELGDLSNLTMLSLFLSGLSGPIPPEIGNLSNLTHLRLDNNDLSGPIPSELGNLSSLEHLDLGANQLTGPIPPEMGNLSNLVTLRLYRNDGVCVPRSISDWYEGIEFNNGDIYCR